MHLHVMFPGVFPGKPGPSHKFSVIKTCKKCNPLSDLTSEFKSSFSLSHSNTDDDVATWYKFLLRQFDRHAPVKTRDLINVNKIRPNINVTGT